MQQSFNFLTNGRMMRVCDPRNESPQLKNNKDTQWKWKHKTKKIHQKNKLSKKKILKGRSL